MTANHAPPDPLGAYDTPPSLCRAILERAFDVVDFAGAHVLEPSAGAGHFVDALVDVAAERLDAFDTPSIELLDLDPFADALVRYAGRPGFTITPCSPAALVPSDPDAGGDVVRCPACLRKLKARGDERRVGRHGRKGVPCVGAGEVGLEVEFDLIPDPVRAGFLVTEPTRRPDVVIANPPYGVDVPWLDQPVAVARLHVDRCLEVTRRFAFVLLRQSFLGPSSNADLYDRGHLRAVWTISPRPRFAWRGQTKGSDSGPSALYLFDLEHEGPTYDGGWLRWDGQS